VGAAPVVLPPFVLILDRIQEPGNLGTMLRTAWAVGLRSVWLTKGSADPYSPKVIRSGMGAQFAVEVAVVEDLAAARMLLESAGGGPLWLAIPDGGIDCFEDGFDLRGGGLVIGNEAGGIDDLSVGRPVSIPMPGNAESLNAAQAATVLLFDAVRRGLMG
jgi:TrmH family RNA methyltransferase